MTEVIDISSIGPNAIDRLYGGILREAWPACDVESIANYARRNDVILGAAEDHEAVGILFGSIDRTPEPRADLALVAVKKSARHTGIARQLGLVFARKALTKSRNTIMTQATSIEAHLGLYAAGAICKSIEDYEISSALVVNWQQLLQNDSVIMKKYPLY